MRGVRVRGGLFGIVWYLIYGSIFVNSLSIIFLMIVTLIYHLVNSGGRSYVIVCGGPVGAVGVLLVAMLR